MVPNALAAEMTAKLCDDLRSRWSRGDRAPAENYLANQPDLAQLPDAQLDLIYTEFVIREELGEHPQPQEYVARFPQFADELARLFKVHSLASQGGSTMPPSEVELAESSPPAPWPTPSHETPPGLVLGDYELLEPLGQGGMGVVHKARHRRMDRIVALKLISPGAMKDEASVKRFQREVKAAARLVHPNIVTAYDAGEQQGTHFLVMEYVEGADLASVVKQHGPLSVEQALDCMAQAAKGLTYAHGKGVIHRDVKPANLLLDSEGTVKILDMGLARVESGVEDLTGDEQIMGTVDYMSPEQATDSHRADERADVYSLGCTLWHVLTAQRVYEGSTLVERLMKHRDAPLPELSRQRADVPSGVEAVFRKMVAKRPEDRFATMTEVVAALDGLRDPAPRPPGGSVASDSRLSEFLKTLAAPPSAATRRGIAAGHAVTSTLKRSDVETDPQSQSRLSKSVGRNNRGRKPPRVLIATAAVLFAGLVFAGIWVIIRNDKGEEVGRYEVPAGGSATTVVDPPPAAPKRPEVATPGRPAALTHFQRLTSLDFEWTAPEEIGPPLDGTGAGANFDNGQVAFLDGGLTMLFASINADTTRAVIRSVQRASLDAPWGAPQVALASDGGFNPTVSADGRVLLFTSSRIDTIGVQDIYQATSTKRLEFQLTQHFGLELNSPKNESSGTLSADGLTFVFASDREGGHGSTDLWMAQRTAPSESFTEAVNLSSSINTASKERGPYFLADGSGMLYCRNEKLWIVERRADGSFALPTQLSVPIPEGRKSLSYPCLLPDGVTLYFSARSDFAKPTDYWQIRRVPRQSAPASVKP